MTSDPSQDRPPGAESSKAEPKPPPPPPPPAPPATDSGPAKKPESPVTFTRAAALWTALFVGFLVLILLLVFILQNTETTTIYFMPWEWNLPLGVAILFAAVGGGLLTIAAGAARIFQLRRVAKKSVKARQ